LAQIADLGNGLIIESIAATSLREQNVNARAMHESTFGRLVENIRQRGALESLPYCSQPNGEGPVDIISGHHRVRASIRAGLEDIHVLVDRNPMTRSTLTAKQLAHNALSGMDDVEVLRQMLATIDTPDDLLLSGVDEDMLNQTDADAMLLFTPRLDFDWKTVSLAFLSHQLTDFDKLLDALENRQDLIGTADVSQFEDFVRSVTKFARIHNVRSAGTAVALLTRIARREVERHGRNGSTPT
jgi:hypothetical protein